MTCNDVDHIHARERQGLAIGVADFVEEKSGLDNINKNNIALTKKITSKPWGRYTFFALIIILVVRLVSLKFNTTALFFDESQYWLWGKEPDLGYFSKPPLLGWIIAAFTTICGSDSEFCVRLPSPIIHTASACLIYFSAVKLFDARTGFWTAIIFATLPGISLSSTLISTDVPLLFCWAGALLAFVHLQQEPGWKNALWLGMFIGAGMMAKYAMAYFFLCAILYGIF